MSDETTNVESLDLIWGATAIAAILNTTRRRTFHMLENGTIPARKIGERWVVSRRVLRDLFEPERGAA